MVNIYTYIKKTKNLSRHNNIYSFCNYSNSNPSSCTSGNSSKDRNTNSSTSTSSRWNSTPLSSRSCETRGNPYRKARACYRRKTRKYKYLIIEQWWSHRCKTSYRNNCITCHYIICNRVYLGTFCGGEAVSSVRRKEISHSSRKAVSSSCASLQARIPLHFKGQRMALDWFARYWTLGNCSSCDWSFYGRASCHLISKLI